MFCLEAQERTEVLRTTLKTSAEKILAVGNRTESHEKVKQFVHPSVLTHCGPKEVRGIGIVYLIFICCAFKWSVLDLLLSLALCKSRVTARRGYMTARPSVESMIDGSRQWQTESNNKR